MDSSRLTDRRDRTTVNARSTPLHWIRDHAQDASVDGPRSHFAAAVRATAQILAHDGRHPRPPCRQLSGQERARV